MKKLLVYLKKYRKECVLAPLFKLFEACFELIVPLVIANIIDNGIGVESGFTDKGVVYSMCALMVAFGVIGLLCAVVAQFFAAKAAVGFSTALKSTLFGKLQSLSYTELDTLGQSTMITRMTGDVNAVQNGINLVLRLFLRAPIIVFGAMIMAFTVNLQAALTFAVVIPLLALVVYGIMWLTIPLYKKVQGGVDRILGLTRENLTGARVIRAFGQEEHENAEFRKSNDSLSVMQRFAGRLSALTNPLTFLLLNGAIVALIYTGAIRVTYGELTQGQVVALYNYMLQILVELIKLANLIVTVTKALACANRIQAVMEMSPSIISPDQPTGLIPGNAGEVEFQNVGLTYSGAGAPSLSGISFSVKKGETLGILGGTGSGKTSVVNLIPRFYDATEGSVTVGGINVKALDPSALRARIGVTPQKPQLFAGSVRDNLKMGNENATDTEMLSALRDAQALDFINEKGGLDFKIEQNGRNLSGGQKQRLTVARALVRRPEILILDDSASALDYATDASMRNAISALDYNPTVFIVSQRAGSVLHADRVLVLEDGEMAGYGAPDELLRTCPVYREIYYCQFPEQEDADSGKGE
ncbi:MAG: ABC transporter ATP-binding protein [Clostridia bacterium]|nr:ABC transporter ATP-binding protein [Clostridia bacterium]